ncbi:MAG TPA: hypothetical protein VGP55_01035 [Chitinophagaceae bacterium]|nr:hypothetical protein [Chitinophagaceae bacterium]
MKFYLNLFCICCLLNTSTSFAFAISKSRTIENPRIIKFSTNLNARDFVKLSAKDFSLITGKKMNLWNRISFTFLKVKMKHDLKKNPDLKVNDYYAKEGKKHLSVWWIVGIGIVTLLLIFLIYAAAALHP